MTQALVGKDLYLDGFDTDRIQFGQHKGSCPELVQEHRPLHLSPGLDEVVVLYQGVEHHYTGGPRLPVGPADGGSPKNRSRYLLAVRGVRMWRLLLDRCGDKTCLLCCHKCRPGGKEQYQRQKDKKLCRRCAKKHSLLQYASQQHTIQIAIAQSKSSEVAAAYAAERKALLGRMEAKRMADLKASGVKGGQITGISFDSHGRLAGFSPSDDIEYDASSTPVLKYKFPEKHPFQQQQQQQQQLKRKFDDSGEQAAKAAKRARIGDV